MRSSGQLIKRFLIVLGLPALSACSSFEIADIGPMVTLPASGDCYRVKVLSHEKTRFPKGQCDELKKRGIFLTSDDWQMQRYSIQKNCQLAQCAQLVGVFDDLFLAIDQGLRSLPGL